MAKDITKIDNLTDTQVDASIKDLWKAEAEGQVAMRDICLRAAAATLAGKYPIGDITAVGKRVYTLSGRDTSDARSFSAQASKIAKTIKLAARWDKAGLPVLEAAFSVAGTYNNTLDLIGYINAATKDAKAPPTAAQVSDIWIKGKPKSVAKEKSNADMGAEVVALLLKLVEADPSGKGLKAALTGMQEYTKFAGLTTAEQKAAKMQAKRASDITEALAMIGKKPSNGAQAN
jgi:hypothetical protein